MLIDIFVIFFSLWAVWSIFLRNYFRPQGVERRQRLQLSGRQPRPPLLQTRINAKLQKFSPNWRWLLINEMLLHLFAKFDLHPSDAFWENRCWNDEYSFLNMIGGKLRDHRNSKHANHFKFTNQPRETAALWLYISALSILCQYQQNVPDEVSLLYDIYSSTMKIIRTVFRWLMFAYTIKGVFSLRKSKPLPYWSLSL